MKTIAFINNKGGVGTTTLVYHLANTFAYLGIPTVCFDLDPQANLTSAFLDEGQLEELWKPADGAIGGHARLVQSCFRDFEGLAKEIWDRIP